MMNTVCQYALNTVSIDELKLAMPSLALDMYAGICLLVEFHVDLEAANDYYRDIASYGVCSALISALNAVDEAEHSKAANKLALISEHSLNSCLLSVKTLIWADDNCACANRAAANLLLS